MSLLEWVPSKSIDESRISFLDLPLELRSIVYEELLVFPGYVAHLINGRPITTFVDMLPGMDASCPPTMPSKAVFNIFGICRQITAEAKKIFFSKNTFCPVRNPRVSTHPTKITKYWMPVEPQYAHLITQLRVVLSHPYGRQARAREGAALLRNAFPALKRAVFIIDFQRVKTKLMLMDPGWDVSREADTSLLRARIRKELRRLKSWDDAMPDWVEFEFCMANWKPPPYLGELQTALLLAPHDVIYKSMMAQVARWEALETWILENVNHIGNKRSGSM